MTTTVCRMKESLGDIEACPGRLCPLWDRGCAVECVDVSGRPELAMFFLELRGTLESVRAAELDATGRRRFFERMNAGRSD